MSTRHSYDPEFKQHIESEFAIWMRIFHRAVQARDEPAIVKALARVDALAAIVTLWGMNETQGADGADQTQGVGRE